MSEISIQQASERCDRNLYINQVKNAIEINTSFKLKTRRRSGYLAVTRTHAVAVAAAAAAATSPIGRPSLLLLLLLLLLLHRVLGDEIVDAGHVPSKSLVELHVQVLVFLVQVPDDRVLVLHFGDA